MDHLKTCSKCREAKPRGEFHRDESRKDGLQSRCKACVRAKDAARYTADRERVIARVSAWAKANPDAVKAREDRRLTRTLSLARRYLSALKHFEGRPGWTSIIYQSYLRAPYRSKMAWAVPALEEYLSEFA